jgi:hypothetical protein
MWDAHWKNCVECGAGFSSPWELICSACWAAFTAPEGEGGDVALRDWLNLTQPNWWHPGWSAGYRSWQEQREWTLSHPYQYRKELNATPEDTKYQTVPNG